MPIASAAQPRLTQMHMASIGPTAKVRKTSVSNRCVRLVGTGAGRESSTSDVAPHSGHAAITANPARS